MKIQVWQGKSVGAKQSWFWHFRQSNGRVVSDAEPFSSKSNAIRAAKAAVKAIIRPVMPPEIQPITFKTAVGEKGGGIIITWF